MDKTIKIGGRPVKVKIDLSAEDLLVPIEKVNKDIIFMKRSRMLKCFIVILTMIMGICVGVTFGISRVALYLDESIRLSILSPILITDEIIVLLVLASVLLLRYKIYKAEVEFDARRADLIFKKKDLTEESLKDYATLYKYAYKAVGEDEVKRELALIASGFEDKPIYHLVEKCAEDKVYLQVWSNVDARTVGVIEGINKIADLKGKSLIINKAGITAVQEV